MFAHPVNLGETRFTKSSIRDELYEEHDEAGEDFVRIVSSVVDVNQEAISFGAGWNIVKDMIIQDI